MNSNQLGLYIHIPFCKSKCYYCDFNSFATKNSLMPAYYKAVIREIEYYHNIIKHQDYIVKTIFIGGGTPSFMPPGYISEILEKCQNTFTIKENSEITIEANPGTLTKEKLAIYKKSGINRLSIGLQAWQNKHLKTLGRTHTAEDFKKNVILAKQMGIENISADLIFGIPGQTINDWSETLDNVLQLDINHLSCYSLKIEEGTILSKMVSNGELCPLEDEIDREMYHNTIKKLNHMGFNHYEISNFSKPGYESRHNLIYWNREPYIGLGAGSHSYFEGRRFNNIENPEAYISHISQKRIPKENIEQLTIKDNIVEFMILKLRLIDGFHIEEFNQTFGISLHELYQVNIDNLIKRGLLEIKNEYLKLTSLGLDLANQVFMEFL